MYSASSRPLSGIPVQKHESGTDRPVRRAAMRAIERLELLAERPPCAIFIGERNAGKSTAANRVIGSGLLPSHIVASTRHATLVRYAALPSLHAILADGRRVTVASPADLADGDPLMLEVGLPVARLKNFEVLDTPAGFDTRRLEALPGLTGPIIAVWCTMATQAWKANEQASWLALDSRIRRHGVLAVTALDRIADDGERSRLADRLTGTAGRCFRAIAASSREPLVEEFAGGAALAETLETLARQLGDRRRRTVCRLATRIRRLAGLVAAGDAAGADEVREPARGAPAPVTQPAGVHEVALSA
ncbi:MAG: hypothetical protein R3D27_03700 [Hyphomicrobiaceae bacterium]